MVAAGRPIVAFGVGGVPEIVEDGRNGLLVPRGDFQALTQAITRVLGDPELAKHLAEQALRHSADFAIERHVKRLEQIYQEVAGTGTGAG